MNNQIKIRKAIPDDVHIIFHLIRELAEYERLLHEVKATELDLQKVLFGERAYVEVLIAEYEDTPVGYALFYSNFSTFIGKPGIFLEDLFVKPDYRGRGLGKAMLESIIALAKDRNCGRVEWSVLDWNETAIEFYKSRGAVALDDWTVFRLTEDKF